MRRHWRYNVVIHAIGNKIFPIIHMFGGAIIIHKFGKAISYLPGMLNVFYFEFLFCCVGAAAMNGAHAEDSLPKRPS